MTRTDAQADVNEQGTKTLESIAKTLDTFSQCIELIDWRLQRLERLRDDSGQNPVAASTKRREDG